MPSAPLFKDLIPGCDLTGLPNHPFPSPPHAHGKLRFAQGYSVSMLVEESRIFQVSTFSTLHLHQAKLDQDQVLLDGMTIADGADRLFEEAVRSFTAAVQAAAWLGVQH